MSDLDSTTTVEVVLRGRTPTIQDVRAALDTLTAEGIPETFEVRIDQREERVYEKDVDFNDRKREWYFSVRAERVAKSTSTTGGDRG